MIKIKEAVKNKIVKNAGWLIAGKVIQMLISFFVGIITARYLGPSNYGLINYGAAYTGFFTALCTLGINSILVKELVDHPDNDGQVLGTAVILKATASILSAVTIFAIVSIVDRDEPVTIMVVALCSIGLVFNVLETFNYWFQSQLKSKVTAIATLIGYIVTSAYKIFLIISGKSVVFFALATSLDYVCVGLILIIAYRKNNGAKVSFSWEYGKQLLEKSCHFILPSLMVAIYAQTDKLMLKQMISDTELGYYSTSAALCVVWCFVLQAIIDSMTPPIMEDYKSGNIDGYVTKNKLLYAIVFYLAITVSIMFCILAHPIIYVLYGKTYLPSIGPLRIITWYTAFSYLGVAREPWVVCENKQKYLIWIYISGALSNIVLNYLLIPKFGASGAAIASFSAQIVTSIIAPFFIKPLRPNVKLIVDGILLRGLIKKQDVQDEKMK